MLISILIVLLLLLLWLGYMIANAPYECPNCGKFVSKGGKCTCNYFIEV